MIEASIRACGVTTAEEAMEAFKQHPGKVMEIMQKMLLNLPEEQIQQQAELQELSDKLGDRIWDLDENESWIHDQDRAAIKEALKYRRRAPPETGAKKMLLEMQRDNAPL